MGISLLEVYRRTLRTIDDPDLITDNQIAFCKEMFNYFENAYPRFDNPFIVANILRQGFSPHTSLVETFTEQTNTIPEEFDMTRANCLYTFTVDGNPTDVNIEDGQIMFLTAGSVYMMEQYFIGEIDISSFSLSEQTKIIDILVILTALAWGYFKRNYLLDIQNILYDTDFKLHSNSAVLQSKNQWIRDMEAQADQAMNHFAWLRKANGRQGVVN